MKKIIYIVLIIALIGGGLFFLSNKEKAKEPNLGQEDLDTNGIEDEEYIIDIDRKLPNFTLQNMAGEEKSLRDYEGKITFLNFWASWCPPCRQEMPDLQEIHENYDDVLILTVNMDEKRDRDKAIEFYQDGGYTFEVLMDDTLEVGTSFYVSAFPTTFFLDKEGILRGVWPGLLTLEQMEEAVVSLREF